MKMVSHIENIVSAYKTLAKIPSILGAKLNNAGNRVSAKWSIRNFDKGRNTKYTTNYILDDSFTVLAQSEFGTDATYELLSAVSPQETYKAIIREDKNGKDVKKQYLEVWAKNSLVHCIDLTALDIHGEVYADSEFGSLDWSHDETSLVYVAERKEPKSEPYIKRKGEDKPKPDGNPPKKGEEYLHKEDWGEQLVGKYSSVVVVCNVEHESFTILDHLPKGCCPGQVRFTSSGAVVGVAWETLPRRLGLIFCTNRPGFIFSMDLDGTFRKLSTAGVAVRSPRVISDGSVVWLQRAVDGPHHACQQLVILKTDSTQPSPVIDIVQTHIAIRDGMPFHGIYSQALPWRCAARDGRRLVFSSPQKDELRAYVVDVDNGDIVDISIKSSPGSTSVLDVKDDVIVASYSNLTTPAQLFVARLPPKGTEAGIQWMRVSDPHSVPPSLTTSTIDYLQLEHKDTDDDVKSFTAIYFAPKSESKLPLIVWPHGGPHSNFVNAYSLEAALFNLLGFASVQINYRGSTGAGDKSTHFLTLNHRAGTTDVLDCKLATDVAVTKYDIDGTKLVLFGGSHGGFLVTHLSGQYPDVYCAVVTRNPVVDVATMFNYTDINDWCAVEAGFPYTESGPVSEEQLLLMRRCSPLAHVHKVKAPTALMLGSGDKRVPYYQGLEYARRLRANGVETRVYVYEDNHSLSSPAAEMDNLINSAHWLLSHVNPEHTTTVQNKDI